MLYLIVIALVFSNVFQFVYFRNKIKSANIVIPDSFDSIEHASKLPRTLFSRLYGDK